MHNSEVPFCQGYKCERCKRWRGQRALISEQSGSGDRDLTPVCTDVPQLLREKRVWVVFFLLLLFITAAVTLWKCKRKKHVEISQPYLTLFLHNIHNNDGDSWFFELFRGGKDASSLGEKNSIDKMYTNEWCIIKCQTLIIGWKSKK